MLQRRDLIPHFVVTTLAGHEVRYADIWHRRFLVLVCVPDPAEAAVAYAARLASMCDESIVDTACVVTTMLVAGVPRPGLVVADRYGEVAFVTAADAVEQLPPPDDVESSLRTVAMRC